MEESIQGLGTSTCDFLLTQRTGLALFTELQSVGKWQHRDDLGTRARVETVTRSFREVNLDLMANSKSESCPKGE